MARKQKYCPVQTGQHKILYFFIVYLTGSTPQPETAFLFIYFLLGH